MSVDHIVATLLMLAALGGLIAWICGYVDDDEGDDERDWTDEDGWVRRPGEDVREGWLP